MDIEGHRIISPLKKMHLKDLYRPIASAMFETCEPMLP